MLLEIPELGDPRFWSGQISTAVVLHGLRRDVARRGAGAEPDDPCCWRVQNRMISVSGATRTVRFVVLQELDMRWTARLRIGGYNPMIRVAGDSRTG